MGSAVGQDAPGRAAARCIVWHAPDASPPARLLERLATRRVQVMRCTDPMHAMMHLCNEVRPKEKAIIILADPRELPFASEFVTTAQAHLPNAVCWMYDATERVPLRAVTASDVHAWSGTEAPPAEPAPMPAPRPTGARQPGPILRLIGGSADDDDLGSLPKPASQEQDDDASTLLTTAELAMLLSDQPPPEPPTTPHDPSGPSS